MKFKIKRFEKYRLLLVLSYIYWTKIVWLGFALLTYYFMKTWNVMVDNYGIRAQYFDSASSNEQKINWTALLNNYNLKWDKFYTYIVIHSLIAVSENLIVMLRYNYLFSTQYYSNLSLNCWLGNNIA